ncbi:hypothetical protein GGU10DRAFT_331702 [Lentinula aff. detonsa]|uniref:Uncharacterized protein n=1 Tax=Lentinula aff. detonsa TaxID=2804958 RepID=A0AA38KRW1_9AGAR|nr:hypothetical protein GGU10DRAFT_331702 [Lentinula aff. detonsa]
MRFSLLLNFWTACLVIGLISVVCAAPRPVDNAMASLSDDQSLPPSSPFSTTVEIQPRSSLKRIDVTFLYPDERLTTDNEDAWAQIVIRALIKEAAGVLDIQVRAMPWVHFYNYPGHWTRDMVLEAELFGPDVCKQKDLRKPQDCTLRAARGSPGYYEMEIRNGAGDSVFWKDQISVEEEVERYNARVKKQTQREQKQRLKDRFRPTHY